MKAKITTFLTFDGRAKEAMDYYTENVPGTTVKNLQFFTEDFPNISKEMVGGVLNGILDIQGQEFMFMDMAPGDAPAFNWATSFYIDCQTEEEFDNLFKVLSDGGSVMMGPEKVLDNRKVAWVVDKFGVTWQPVWH